MKEIPMNTDKLKEVIAAQYDHNIANTFVKYLPDIFVSRGKNKGKLRKSPPSNRFAKAIWTGINIRLNPSKVSVGSVLSHSILGTTDERLLIEIASKADFSK